MHIFRRNLLNVFFFLNKSILLNVNKEIIHTELIDCQVIHFHKSFIVDSLDQIFIVIKLLLSSVINKINSNNKKIKKLPKTNILIVQRNKT